MKKAWSMKWNFLKWCVCTLVLALPLTAHSQDALDRFSIDSGGGTSTGGGFAVNGTIRHVDTAPMSGGDYTMSGEFRSLILAVPPVVVSTAATIFDNTNGSNNGLLYASTANWLANEFCLGSQSYTLDAVTLPLDTREPSTPPVVRLQIYSDDPVTGKPSASTGVMMNLSGESNPIQFTFAASSYAKSVTWIPATPFVLAANTCYWVVLSTESGEVSQTVSVTLATGAAAAVGRASSTDAGATWGGAGFDHTSVVSLK